MTPKREYTDYLRDLLHCAAAQRFVAGIFYHPPCMIYISGVQRAGINGSFINSKLWRGKQ